MSIYKFLIIGSGPAGIYTSKYLLKKFNYNSIVHLVEKDLFAGGLARYGVAPDNAQCKLCINDLDDFKNLKNFKISLNCEIKDYEIIKNNYSSILWCTGAGKERKLNLNEDKFKNVFTNYDFINFYNSKINDYSKFFRLDKKIKNVTIIGNGNAALDIARMIYLDNSKLEKTDINKKFLYFKKKYFDRENLNINIIARRGIFESAFDLKELRELEKVTDNNVFIDKKDIEKCESELNLEKIRIITKIEQRALKRKYEFLKKLSKKNLKNKNAINLKYLLKPLKFYDHGLYFNKNYINKNNEISETEEKIFMESDIVITSLGFDIERPQNNILFDKNNFLNLNGILLNKKNELNFGEYCCGWSKIGTKGKLNETYLSSEESIQNNIFHIKNNRLKQFNNSDFNKEGLKIKYNDINWYKIRKYEKKRNYKINDIDEYEYLI